MFAIGLLIGILLGCAGTYSAYRNGVTDGFGFSIEPRNPGYRKAGRYLVDHMSHRWGHVLTNPMYVDGARGEVQKSESLPEE
jgi:hypothetical protein